MRDALWMAFQTVHSSTSSMLVQAHLKVDAKEEGMCVKWASSKPSL